MLPRTLIATSAALAALAVPAAAQAGPPGAWTRVTAPDLTNTAQVGAARTADGRLHVLWEDRTRHGVFHTTFSGAGKKLGTATVVAGWDAVSDPALVTDAAGTGLVGFWGSVRDAGSAADPNGNDAVATLPAGAAGWTVGPSFSLLDSTGQDDDAHGQAMSAARLGATPFQAFGAMVHRGLSPAQPSYSLQALIGGGCCGYDANVAADATSVHAAWYSNATGKRGVWAVPLSAATGQPAAAPARMPGTSTASATQTRTAIAAAGGHDFVAYPGGYPVARRALLWREGAAKSIVLARASEVRGVALAAGPGGRLWAAIAERAGSKSRLVVRRSNPGVTRWGAPVVVRLPKGTSTIWRVDAVAGAGRLDVLAHVHAAGSHEATWQTQVRPGLTLTAKPARLHRGHTTKVRLRVTDAGAAVKGAKVRLAGHKGTTNAKGRVTLAVGPFGQKARAATARARRAGYGPAALRLRIRRH